MTRQVQRRETPKHADAKKKRRALADGPAVRAALALAEQEAQQSDSGGWKLLEAPPDSKASQSTEDGWKLLEVPVESVESDPSGLLCVDSTQPEPNWRVVGVADPPSTNGAEQTAKPHSQSKKSRLAQPRSAQQNHRTNATKTESPEPKLPRTQLSASNEPTPVERARKVLDARHEQEAQSPPKASAIPSKAVGEAKQSGAGAAVASKSKPRGPSLGANLKEKTASARRQHQGPASKSNTKPDPELGKSPFGNSPFGKSPFGKSPFGKSQPAKGQSRGLASKPELTQQVANSKAKAEEPRAALRDPAQVAETASPEPAKANASLGAGRRITPAPASGPRRPQLTPVTGVPRPNRGLTPATGVPRPDMSKLGPQKASPTGVPRAQISPASLLTRPLSKTPARESIPHAVPLPVPARPVMHTQLGVAPPPPPVSNMGPSLPGRARGRQLLDSELDDEETEIMEALGEEDETVANLAALAQTQPGAPLPPLPDVVSPGQNQFGATARASAFAQTAFVGAPALPAENAGTLGQTQSGATPPELPTPPVDLAQTQLGVAPPPLPQAPAQNQLAAPPASPAEPVDLAQTQLGVPPPALPQAALAQTQLGAPPPLPTEPLPTEPHVAIDQTARESALQPGLALAQTQLGVPPPELPPAALTECDNRVSVVEPEPSRYSAPPATLPRSPQPTLQSAVAPIAREPLSSDAFATTHDTVPPGTALQNRTEALPLPGFLKSMPRGRLIGLGSAAVAASCIPLVLFAVGVSSLSGWTQRGATQRPAATAEGKVPQEAKATPQAKLNAVGKSSAAVTRKEPAKSAKPKPAAKREAPANVESAPPPKAPPAEAEAEAAPEPVPPTEAGSASADLAPVSAPTTAGAVPWTAQGNTRAQACKDLAQPNPGGPKAYLLQRAIKRGQDQLMRGNVEGAHVAFCEARLLGDPPATVLLGLAQVLLMQADLDGALEAVDALLKEDPSSQRARDMRGDVLIRLGRVDEALGEWYKAAGATRASQSLTNNLLRVGRMGAKSAIKAGDLARADRMLRRVLALSPSDVEAAAQLASVLLKSGHKPAARAWFDYAASLDPNHDRVQSVERALAAG